ncbi:MAG: right-handed parallel beta-helix repeat-containing protein, partial [Candidatus Aenigmatarchaeota archaeon]
MVNNNIRIENVTVYGNSKLISGFTFDYKDLGDTNNIYLKDIKYYDSGYDNFSPFNFDNSDNITVENFIFTGETFIGYFEGSENINLSGLDVKVYRIRNVLEFFHSKNVNVQNSRIDSGGIGLSFLNASNSLAFNVSVLNSNREGIHTESSNNITLNKITVYNATNDCVYFLNNDMGIEILDSIIDCNVYDGIHASNSDGVYINNNHIFSEGNALFLDSGSDYNQIWDNTFDTGYVSDNGAGNVYCVDGIGNEYVNGASYSGPDPNCGTCECPPSLPVIELDSCRWLDQNNTKYVLTQDVNTNGTCFTFSNAHNVIFEGNGHFINLEEYYPHTVAIDFDGKYNSSNITVRNLKVNLTEGDRPATEPITRITGTHPDGGQMSNIKFENMEVFNPLNFETTLFYSYPWNDSEGGSTHYNFTFDNITARNVNTPFGYGWETIHGAVIKNCRFYNSSSGTNIWLKGTDFEIYDNHIETGMYLESFSDSQVHDNYILSEEAILAINEYSNNNHIWNNTFDTGYVSDSGTGNVYCVDGVGNEYVNGASYSGPDPDCGTCECPPTPIVVEVDSCRNLNTPNTIYILNTSITDHNDTCFSIRANNVTLDCDGFSIDGVQNDNTFGVIVQKIDYSNIYDINIKNCNISEFGIGAWCYRCFDSVIEDITLSSSSYASGIWSKEGDNVTYRNMIAHDNNFAGAYFYKMNNSRMENITAYNNSFSGTYFNRVNNCSLNGADISDSGRYGMYVYSSPNSLIKNMVSRNDFYYNFYVGSSTNFTVEDCVFENAGYYNVVDVSSVNSYYKNINITTGGASLGLYFSKNDASYCNVRVENVLVDGTPTLYYNETVSLSGNANFNTITLCNADNSVLENMTAYCTVPGSGGGIFPIATDNLIVKNLTANNCYFGFAPRYATNVTIDGYSGTNNVYDYTVINLTGEVKNFYAYSPNTTLDFLFQIRDADIDMDNVSVTGNRSAIRLDARYGDITLDIYNSKIDRISSDSNYGAIHLMCSQAPCGENTANLYNTTLTDYNVANSTLNVYWNLDVNNPLGASVTIKNVTNDTVSTFSDVSKSLWLREFYVTPLNVRTDSTPHTIEAVKSGYEDLVTGITMDDNKEVTLELELAPPNVVYIDSCQTLSQENTIYVLTQDITNHSGSCFFISANDTTLDCDNHVVDGRGVQSTDRGIVIGYSRDVTIQNCTIREFDDAISITNKNDYLVITNSNISDNVDNGIAFGGPEPSCNYCNLTNLIITGNTDYGTYLKNFNNGYLYNITANQNIAGVSCRYCENSTFDSLNFNDNTGVTCSSCRNNVFNNITVLANNSGNYGIRLSGYSDNNNLSNIHVDGASWYAIEMGSSGVVRDSVLRNSDRNDLYVSTYCINIDLEAINVTG